MTHHRAGETNPSSSWIGILKVFEIHILNGGSGSIRVTRGDKTPLVTMSLAQDIQDTISKPRKKKSPSKKRKNKIRLENWLKAKHSPPPATSDKPNLECQLIDAASCLPHFGTGAQQGRGQDNLGPSWILKCPENEQCSEPKKDKKKRDRKENSNILFTGDDMTKDIEYRNELTASNHVSPAIPVDMPALCQEGEEGYWDPTCSDENQAQTLEQQMISLLEECLKEFSKELIQTTGEQLETIGEQLEKSTLSFKNARKDP